MRNPAKKLLLFCFAALLSLAAGCTRQQNLESPHMDRNMENGQILYDGTERRFFRVEEGQTGVLTVSVTRESGSLNLSVFPESDPEQYNYRGTELPTSDFTVLLEEPGAYRVWIEAERFAGAYDCEWSVRQQNGE